MARFRTTISHLKELYFVVLIVFAALTAGFSVSGPGGYLELKRTRAALEAHRHQIETLKRENAERLQFIKALRSDKSTLENYAREKGYGRAGEIVQQIEPDRATEAKKGAGESR